MAIKAISFLGYTPPGKPYRETIYCYEGKEWKTSFMAEATTKFFKLDELLVLTTPEAKEQNFDDLQKQIGNNPSVKSIDIPSGRNEDEMWIMFTKIADVIDEGDIIIFDITNGFRSLPVLSFLAASFVRVVKKAYVEKMIYGAYDAQVDGKTPVFDLTPFLTLLDWTTATDTFLKFGQAEDLTELVHNATKGTNQLGNQGTLSGIADRLKTLTAALQTTRPAEVMTSANGLEKHVETVRADATEQAKPFSLLLDKISTEYSPLGFAQPTEKTLSYEVVAKQLEMINWYIDKGFLVQAITLAREWIVSLIVAEVNGDLFDRQDRRQAESAINDHNSSIDMNRIPNNLKIRSAWNQLRDLRNDLAHTGMRYNPRSAADVKRQVTTVCQNLHTLLPSKQYGA